MAPPGVCLITVHFMFVALVTLFCPIKSNHVTTPSCVLPGFYLLKLHVLMHDETKICTTDIMKITIMLWPTGFNTFFCVNLNIQDIKQIL